jgi:hypothetical protein
MNNLFKNNEGSILVIVAISLPIILGLLVIVLNVGQIHYVQSAYTSIATTATATALNPIGDEMVDIINDKMAETPPYIPVSPDAWDNLTDEERTFLTTDSTLVTKVKNTAREYLQKNIAYEGLMRNDFIIKDIEVIYPYEYNLSDSAVKIYLEFRIESPLHFIESMSKKDILIKGTSQLRIK